MKKEIRKANVTEFISNNYANLILCDYPVLSDKEFEYLINVFLKKIRK
jgi:hypothetical protein